MSSEEGLVLIGQSVPGKTTECLTASQSQFPGLGQTEARDHQTGLGLGSHRLCRGALLGLLVMREFCCIPHIFTSQGVLVRVLRLSQRPRRRST